MVKKPDISDLSKKLDLGGIVKSIKSMINPAAGPEVNPDDAIGLKIVELTTKVQEMIKAHEAQTRELVQVNALLNALFKDIESLRHPPEEKPAATDETQSETTEKK